MKLDNVLSLNDLKRTKMFYDSKFAKILLFIIGLIELSSLCMCILMYYSRESVIEKGFIQFMQTSLIVMILSSILYFICYLSPHRSLARFYFMMFSFLVFLGLTCEIISYYYSGIVRFRRLSVFVIFLAYVIDQTLILVLWRMIKALYYGEFNSPKYFDYIITIVTYCSILLIASNLFTGWLYKIDENNLYSAYTPTLILSIPTVIGILLIGIAFYNSRIQLRKLLVFCGFDIMGIIATIADIDYGTDDSYYYVLLFCFQFVIYGLFITSRETEMSKKEAEIASTEKELELANRIQNNMLPVEFSSFKKYGIDVFASMNAAKEVGGDFYDFFAINDKKTAFVIGDVSGKGIPAALFMTIGKTLIHKCISEMDSLSEAITSVHRTICDTNVDDMFFTLWAGVIDSENNTLTYVNASHTKTFVKPVNGGYQELKDLHGLMVGCMLTQDKAYKESKIDFKPGDKLYMYTDGVTEAKNINGEMYNTNKLKDQLDKSEQGTALDVCKSVYDDVKLFQGEAEQFDDITMLAVHYIGNEIA